MYTLVYNNMHICMATQFAMTVSVLAIVVVEVKGKMFYFKIG